MYLVFTIYFFCLMFYEYITGKRDNRLLAFSCALIAVFIAIRYQVGTDYENYYSMFHDLLQDPNSVPRIEIGWRYITYSLSFLGFNEYGCFAFWGILTMALVYYGLKKHSPYPLISCGYFFFVYTLNTCNVVRQMVVCGILLAGLDVIKRRNHWQALALFLIMLSIHKVAVILIPIYILTTYDSFIGKHKYWIILIAFILGVGGYMIHLLAMSGDYVLSDRISHSIHIALTHPSLTAQNSEFGTVLRRLLIILVVIWAAKRIEPKWDYAQVAIPLFFWGYVANFLLISSCVLASRVGLTTKALDLLILPSLLLASENLTWKRCVMAFIIAFSLYNLYCKLPWPLYLGNDYYPYQTIFF